MSIYVLRAGELVKIGYTDDLSTRIKAIIASIPSRVEFVGHMPGDRDVERHFHSRFDNTRFSGEWFVETDEMRAAWSALLTRHLPMVERAKDPKRLGSDAECAAVKERLRIIGAQIWPSANHGQRVSRLSERLGWNRNRVKDLYYGDRRAALRSFEADEIEALLIAPELKDE